MKKEGIQDFRVRCPARLLHNVILSIRLRTRGSPCPISTLCKAAELPPGRDAVYTCWKPLLGRKAFFRPLPSPSGGDGFFRILFRNKSPFWLGEGKNKHQGG